jgi:hypothetical protein
VRPTAGEARLFEPSEPRFWVEAEVTPDRVQTDDGFCFAVQHSRSNVDPLQLGTAVSVPATPEPACRRQVLLALRDAGSMGHVTRQLLARERQHVRYMVCSPAQPTAAPILVAPTCCWFGTLL